MQAHTCIADKQPEHANHTLRRWKKERERNDFSPLCQDYVQNMKQAAGLTGCAVRWEIGGCIELEVVDKWSATWIPAETWKQQVQFATCGHRSGDVVSLVFRSHPWLLQGLSNSCSLRKQQVSLLYPKITFPSKKSIFRHCLTSFRVCKNCKKGGKKDMKPL